MERLELICHFPDLSLPLEQVHRSANLVDNLLIDQCGAMHRLLIGKAIDGPYPGRAIRLPRINNSIDQAIDGPYSRGLQRLLAFLFF